MSNPTFFGKKETHSESEVDFQTKLTAAINLIKKNKSLVALKVLEAILSEKVSIHSYYELSEKHYEQMTKEMKEINDVELPSHYPPTQEAVKLIENELDGIVYDENNIYINSKKKTGQIATILIHEVTHFLNHSLFTEEQKNNNFKRASYSDEVRSFIAEKMFERNGGCIRRSDMKEIHQVVSDLYPEFAYSDEETFELGYIYSSFDSPMS